MAFAKHNWTPAEDGHKVCSECFCSTRLNARTNLDFSPYLTCQANKEIAKQRLEFVSKGIRLMTEAAGLLHKNPS